MKYLKVFLLGIGAGIAIAFGGAAYTACTYYGSEIAGSVLFSCGLLLVCSFGMKLYTGQIGKVFENKISFLLDLFIMYIGNVIGATGCGLLSSLTIPNDKYQDVVDKIAICKIVLLNNVGNEWYKILILGFFCGILVYLGVEIFKKAEHGITKVVGLVLCVAVFVVAGYSHCVANMYYLGNSLFIFKYPLESFLGILIATIGNSLGSIFTWLIFYICNFKKVESGKNN